MPDIDECLTGDNECYPGSVCVNTDGSYYCECLFGEQQGASCFVENPDIYIDQQLTEMTIHVSGEWTTEFPQYRVSLGNRGEAVCVHVFAVAYSARPCVCFCLGNPCLLTPSPLVNCAGPTNAQVSVAKWSYDLAAKEDIHGFPKTIKTPLLDHRVINLEAGTRFRVRGHGR